MGLITAVVWLCDAALFTLLPFAGAGVPASVGVLAMSMTNRFAIARGARPFMPPRSGTE